MKKIRTSSPLIDIELMKSDESDSTFRDAVSHIIGNTPSKKDNALLLNAACLDTPLGAMLAIADEQALYLLEFVDYRRLTREVERLDRRTKRAIVWGRTKPIDQIEAELARYFTGELKTFKTPLQPFGSPFQHTVWQALQTIPYGETRSYLEMAHNIGHPSAVRALANANGANQLAVIIPCHRVINHNGKLGGYGGGLTRKEWLIRHEKGINMTV